MTQNYVVTNYRFDETFKKELYLALAGQQPLELACEEAVSFTTQKVTIQLTPHQVSNAGHIFTCIGTSEQGVCRLEEIKGTLHLSVF